MKNKKKSGCSSIFFIIFIFAILGSVFGGNKDKEKSTDVSTETTTEVTTEPTTEEKSFNESLAEYVGEELANKVSDIYTNDLGFSELRFDSRTDESDNYLIYANSYGTVATISDSYIRIFAPNTSYVFYEDGNVLMTYDDFKDSIIENEEMPKYYSIAQIIVEDSLKSPKSAKFPSSKDISYQKKGNLVAIKGYVDAENSFGTQIRNDYIVQFYVNDLDNLSYETVYLKIGDNESGRFVSYK